MSAEEQARKAVGAVMDFLAVYYRQDQQGALRELTDKITADIQEEIDNARGKKIDADKVYLRAENARLRLELEAERTRVHP